MTISPEALARRITGALSQTAQHLVKVHDNDKNVGITGNVALARELLAAEQLEIVPNDLHMLRSIHRQLLTLKVLVVESHETNSLGLEVLADNINWLDCFIDEHHRKQERRR